MKFFKSTYIVPGLLIGAVVLLAVCFHLNRPSIFDYCLNKLIGSILPLYTEVKRVDFDFENKRLTIKDFRITNPPGFRRTSFIRIPEVNISYSQHDKKSILNGVELNYIALNKPVIYIERSKNGDTNIRRLIETFSQPEKGRRLTLKAKLLGVLTYLVSPTKKIYDLDQIRTIMGKVVGNPGEMIEIKAVMNTKEGSLFFDDRYINYKGYKTSLEDINSKTSIQFKEDLKGIDNIKSEGSGFINGEKDQAVHWVVVSDPKTPRLTMSNAFIIQGISLVHFQPYYNKFSPLVFEDGKASGNLTFNLDNGNIDSLNELLLDVPRLRIKSNFPFNDLWAVSSQDLNKYFLSQSGEIFFDFKIKGPLEKPEFSLGPRTKMAIARMVVDKIADVLLEHSDESQPASGKKKSIIRKIIDKYKQLKEPEQLKPQDELEALPPEKKNGV